MAPSFKITILYTVHPDIFEVTVGVDQFKPQVVNSLIMVSGLTAIQRPMGNDDVGLNKGAAPVKDETIVGEIFIKLIQYEDACRLILINPKPQQFNLVRAGYSNALDG